MAVKLIRGKQITKFDTKKLANNPNFDVSKLKKPEPKVEVSGNVKDDTDIYGCSRQQKSARLCCL